MFTKKDIVRSLIICELLLFSVWYYYGNQGIKVVWHMRQDNALREQHVAFLQAELQEHERDLAQWHTFAFCKEKIAREHLQMARRGDIVFNLTHQATEQYSDIPDEPS